MPRSRNSNYLAEIFAVGNCVAVTGSVAALPARLHLVTPDRLGVATAYGSDTSITIEAIWDDCASSPAKEEAVRMSCRVIQKRWPGAALEVVVDVTNDWIEALGDDGFELTNVGTLRRKPGPFELVAEKSNRTFDVYDSVLDVHWNYVPSEVEAYQTLLSGQPLRVLDIGAGVGKNARVLAAAGHAVTALDASGWAVGRMKALIPDVEGVVASVTSLPFEAGTFDAVIDIGCLHCVPKRHRSTALREVARVLIPNGRLISRIFKPRDPDWIARQPFRVDNFGMSEREVRHLLSPFFSRVEWTLDDPNMHYLTAWTAP